MTQLSDALIIQLNIFKYSGGISKKVVPNLSIDKEILLWGNRMVLSHVNYHEGEQSCCEHYASEVKVDNTWFLISDARISLQQKRKCSSKNISVSYILIYKRITNFLTAPLISLNGTVKAGSTSELITETAETMIRQSVLQELEKQKTKLTIVQEEAKTDSSKVKFLMKTK